MAVTREQILGWTGGSLKGEDVYAASQKYGFNATDYDTAFGAAPGTAQSWIDKNVKAPTAGTPANTYSTPTYTGIPTSKATASTTIPTKVTPVASDKFSGVTPSLVTPNPETSTVQGQLSGVLAKGGPHLTLAGTRAKQEANRRGVINSTMAIGAGERAAIETALPIAQADANTYWNAQTLNQAAENRAAEVSVDSTNQAARAVEDTSMQKLRGDQQKDSDASINQNNRVVSFNNAVAMITSNTNNIIANLRADSTIDAATRQGLIDQVMRDADIQIQRLGTYNDIDTGDLLNFTSTPTPTPAAPAANTGVLSQVRTAVNATASSEDAAIEQIYNAAVDANMSLEGAARELNMTPEKAAQKLAQIGKSLPSESDQGNGYEYDAQGGRRALA